MIVHLIIVKSSLLLHFISFFMPKRNVPISKSHKHSIIFSILGVVFFLYAKLLRLEFSLVYKLGIQSNIFLNNSPIFLCSNPA